MDNYLKLTTKETITLALTFAFSMWLIVIGGFYGGEPFISWISDFVDGVTGY